MGDMTMTQTAALDIEQMYQAVAQDILHFRHKPGDMISESSLCQRFGVSRTPARSILQRLQENALVQILPRRGSIVTRLNYDIVDQMIYERVAVESMVLRDFILTCTPADVERVRFALAQLQSLGRVYAVDRTQFESSRFLQTDYAMHEIWFHATNKHFLWKRLSSVNSSYTRFCTLDILEGDNVPDVVQEHTQMVELIDRRCTEGIEPLMRRHLYGGMRRLSGLMFTKYADYFEPMDGKGSTIP